MGVRYRRVVFSVNNEDRDANVLEEKRKRFQLRYFCDQRGGTYSDQVDCTEPGVNVLGNQRCKSGSLDASSRIPSHRHTSYERDDMERAEERYQPPKRVRIKHRLYGRERSSYD